MPANTGDLKLALVIQAASAQAKAALGEVQAQIAAVNAESGKTAATAAAASDAVVSAAGAEAAAAKATGAAQAERGAFTRQTSEEIAQMVRNSLAAVEADRAASKAAAEAAAARRAEGAAASASAKSNAELVAAQTAQMSRWTAARAPVLALQQILAKSVLTTAEVAQAETLLDRAQASGIISAGELKEAFAALDAAKIKDVAVTQAQTAANVEATVAMNSRARREVGTLGAEALSGNFGRVRTSGLALANDVGLFTKLLSPMGLLITGTAVAVGTLAAAFAKGQAENSAFNSALALTGGYAGQTAGQLQALSAQLGQLQGASQHAAAAVVAQVTASGQFYGSQVQQVSRTALQMQQVTGQSVDETIKQFERLGKDPVQGILDLNSKLHFLTQGVYDQITALVQQGDTDRAAQVAQDAYAAAVDKRANAIQQNLGTLQKAWRDLATGAKTAWDAMLDLGRASTPESKIADLQKQLEAQEKLLANGGDQRVASPGLGGAPGIPVTVHFDTAQIKQTIANLKAQLAQASSDAMWGSMPARQAALGQRATDNALAAQNALASGAGQSSDQQLTKRLSDLALQKTRALYGVTDPAKRQEIIEQFNRQVADAAKRYDSATKALAPKADPADHTADQLARAGAAAQQDLAQSLASLQGQLNPTAAIWNTYNKAVEKANADAEAAKAAHVGDAQAIDAQRDAVVQLAGQVRDAALDKQTEAARRAWEQLRRSMESPIDARIDDAIDKIQKLNKELAAGAGDADQYHALVKSVGENSVQPAPNYRGPGAAVGGPAGELQKNYQAEIALNKWRNDQIAAENKKFNDADAGQAEAHAAARAKIDKEYAQRSAIIDQARSRLQLDTAADLFGQLAALSSSGNRRLAAIGKAAAIAQTIIKTYESATSAYAAMASIPYIGPVLGAAAAAAAIAAGLANVAAIRSQATGSYAEGGYTGAGEKHSIAGFVHAGEVVFSQADVARHGGPAAVNAMRLRGYADGGFVHPMANAPTPAELGFAAPVTPALDMNSLAAASAQTARPQVNVKTVVVQSPDQLAAEILNTPTGTKLVIQHVGDNPNAIQGKWHT